MQAPSGHVRGAGEGRPDDELPALVVELGGVDDDDRVFRALKQLLQTTNYSNTLTTPNSQLLQTTNGADFIALVLDALLMTNQLLLHNHMIKPKPRFPCSPWQTSSLGIFTHALLAWHKVVAASSCSFRGGNGNNNACPAPSAPICDELRGPEAAVRDAVRDAAPQNHHILSSAAKEITLRLLKSSFLFEHYSQDVTKPPLDFAELVMTSAINLMPDIAALLRPPNAGIVQEKAAYILSRICKATGGTLLPGIALQCAAGAIPHLVALSFGCQNSAEVRVEAATALDHLRADANLRSSIADAWRVTRV